MNGPCCQSRLTLLKWPALLTLALMLSYSPDRPVLAATPSLGTSSAMTRTVQEGPVTLEVTLDRTEALVAEPIRLTLVARAPEGVQVRFPEPGGRLGDFDITRADSRPDVPVGSDRTWTQVLRLESLTSGARELPAITLTYTDERQSATTDAAGTISTPALPITVVSEVEANADPMRFRDIKGVAALAEPEATSRGWILGGAAGAAILALAGFWLVVHTRREQSPAEWALGELERWERSGFVAEGHFDTFFCGVTDILREYIERQFAIRAPHLTTREFLAQVEGDECFDDDGRRMLAAFLELADVVKFARFDVNDRDAARALEHGRRFIDSTSRTAITDVSPKRPARRRTKAKTAIST